MLRQIICPVAIVLLAVAGIGSFLLTSEHAQNANAEKQESAQPKVITEIDPDFQRREQRLLDINQVLARRAPEFGGNPPQATLDPVPVWADPEHDKIYQQIIKKRARLWFPRNNEPFSIWVGNPYQEVDGKKVYEHAQVLNDVVPLINQLPFPVRIWFYGTRDQSNPELGECINALADIKQLAGIKFSLCRINDQGYTALKNLPNLTDLEILYSHLDEAAVAEIIQMKRLKRLHLDFSNNKISLKSAESILTLPELQDLKLHVDVPGVDVTPFWEKMTDCTQLTDVEIDLGSVTEKAMLHFLTKGNRENLQTLYIREIFPRKRLAQALQNAPNLQVLKVPSGKDKDMLYLLDQLASHHPRLKQLVVGWDTGNHLTGEQARTALNLLTSFPELERCHIPIDLPDSAALKPLLELPHLEYVYCKNLNLDQETLLLLAQMPTLKRLEVDRLEFDENAAHLLPWLTNIQKIEIKDPTTLTDERLELLATMPRLNKLTWCDIAIKDPVPLSKAARARFPQITYEVCGK